MVNRSYLMPLSRLCCLWLEGWDQNVLVKIGHTANKQSERIEMEVSTVGWGWGGGGWTDRCVSLSIILDLLGD